MDQIPRNSLLHHNVEETKNVKDIHNKETQMPIE
jgi:hypothetical protein